MAGVDEAGRGPLAGPVIAAAVILDPLRPIPGLADSKVLSPERRESLAQAIQDQALAWALGSASVEEIDRLNILQAALLAMRRAVAGLRPAPLRVLVDGNQAPQLGQPVRAIVGGDRYIPAISAASILAKVVRDAEMRLLEGQYPGYGFARHKGYPTREHLRRLGELGVTAVHRRSFGPVRALLTATSQSERLPEPPFVR